MRNKKKPCKHRFTGPGRWYCKGGGRAWSLACPFGDVARLSRRFCVRSPESTRIKKKPVFQGGRGSVRVVVSGCGHGRDHLGMLRACRGCVASVSCYAARVNKNLKKKP